MSNNEQLKGGEQNQEPTEAEEILGSMEGKFDKTQAESERKKVEKKKQKEADPWDLAGYSDFDLLETEDYYRRNLDEIYEGTARGMENHLNRSMYERELKDIQKEKERRGTNRPEYIEAEEILRDTKDVKKAIWNTEETLGDYFENTCKQRLADGVGSIYDSINSTDDMSSALFAAHWKKTEHPDVMPGCQAYVTKDIKGGHLGLLRIADLPDDAAIIASDPKGTGKVSMTVSGEKGPEVEDTWLIVGKEDGVDVVFTFHPGEPVRPSVVEVKDCPDGTKLTKEQALNLGFDLAKIV
ncbi:hypothetical protein IKD67_03325 [Candidatus Saccharibacteria bacterium]|nr:hypothetical protein [Candidatus Saccharibacteria bacterium]